MADRLWSFVEFFSELNDSSWLLCEYLKDPYSGPPTSRTHKDVLQNSIYWYVEDYGAKRKNRQSLIITGDGYLPYSLPVPFK